MPLKAPKGLTEIPGYGKVRQFAGASPSGNFRVVRIHIDFGDVDGLKLINEVIDKMNRVNIRDQHGEASSMMLHIAVDCRGHKKFQEYACKTREDIVAQLVATAREHERKRDRANRHEHTPAQQGDQPVVIR